MVAALAVALSVFTREARAQERVIPPGREALLGAMLGRGAALPGGCRFAGAEIRASSVRARYDCGAGRRAVLELRDRDDPTASAARAGPFAITPTGEVPDGLLDAVALRVRARQSEWSWGSREGPVRPARGAPAALRAALLPLLTIALLAFFVGRGRSGRELLRALAAIAATLLILSLRGPEVPLHEDTVRDLLIARDCVEADLCHGLGATASFAGLAQGTSWLQVLEGARRLALAPDGIRAVVAALAAVAGGVVCLAANGRVRPDVTIVAGAAFGLAASRVSSYPELWNPSVVALPSALFAAFFTAAATTGRASIWIAAGASLGLAIDGHVVSAALVPLFLAVLVGSSEAPVRTLLLATAAATGACALLSPAAFARNQAIVSQHGFVVALFAAPILVGWALRRRALALRGPLRATTALAAVSGLYLLGLAAAWRLSTHPLAARYLLPVLPMLALLAAGALDLLASRLAALVRRPAVRAPLVAGAGVLLVTMTAGGRDDASSPWQLAEVQRAAAHVEARGWSWPDLYVHLHGADAWELVSGLGLFMAPGPGRVTRDDDLVIVRAPRRVLPRPLPARWDVVTLGRDQTAVLRSLPSFLDRRHVRVCRSQACVDVSPTAEALAPGPGPFSRRAYLSWAAVARRFPPGLLAHDRSARLSYEFDARVPSGAGAHEIALCATGAWRVEGVRGSLRAEVRSPHRLVLAGEEGATGTVVVSAASDVQMPYWPPEVFETDVSEGELRGLMRAQDTRRCEW